MSSSTIFTNNRSQAVRLPADARFPDSVRKVEVRVVGLERVIAPASQAWDSFFAADSGVPRATADFMRTRASQKQRAREAL
jgi:antitoxin VapB